MDFWNSTEPNLRFYNKPEKQFSFSILHLLRILPIVSIRLKIIMVYTHFTSQSLSKYNIIIFLSRVVIINNKWSTLKEKIFRNVEFILGFVIKTRHYCTLSIFHTSWHTVKSFGLKKHIYVYVNLLLSIINSNTCIKTISMVRHISRHLLIPRNIVCETLDYKMLKFQDDNY